MKFKKTYTVGVREVGCNNRLTNYGLLAYLEDVAVSHSDTVGYGVKDIWTKKRAWLLMDWELEVVKRPSFGEKITALTWATEIKKPTFHVYRDFEVLDENNNLVATATSKWLLFDTENNKITKVDDSFMVLYKPEGSDESARSKIDKIKEPEGYSNLIEYKVKRADIDMNQHVHNLNYLNIAYEALPQEVYENQQFDNLHIMYKHQIKPEDTVRCFYQFENGRHFVTIKSQDEKLIHSIIELW